MDYTFIIIGFIGGAVLILIIWKLIFKKETIRSLPDTTSTILNNEEIRAGVKMLLHSGKKIEAIKFIKEQKNLGLADSKKLVDLIETLGPNDASVFKSLETQENNPSLDPELLNQVRKFLTEGKKIQAIKLVVQNKKIGLKEAKDFVDGLEQNYRA